jgi:hypothetical protein
MTLPYRLRFVGVTRLPRSLTESDIEAHFTLSSDDVNSLNERFSPTHRLGAALQYLLLRATGRHLDQTTIPPRLLLRSVQEKLGGSALSIASLRSLYRRRATLHDHQQWARARSGFAEPSDHEIDELSKALKQWASGAASVDDLVQESERWLFERKRIIPSDRRLRDYARIAFADTEAAALHAVKQELSNATITKISSAVYAKRERANKETVFEWLKTPSAKHGPSSLSELIEKIDYLKTLGVATWSFSALSRACLRAYAQQCANRRASFLRLLVPDTQTLEIACFLRATLLDLTDASLYMGARRINDLYRHAAARVSKYQTQQAHELRERELAIRSIVHANDQTAEQKIDTLKILLPAVAVPSTTSHAASVRLALAQDSVRVTGLLKAFQSLTIQGEAGHKALRQMTLLLDLEQQSAKQLPENIDASMVDAGWHALIQDDDRVLALGALKAATLTTIRKGLRAGTLWIDHSWRYREQELMLSPKAVWQAKRSELVNSLSLTLDPKKFLQRLHAHLDSGLEALSEAVRLARSTSMSKAECDCPRSQLVRSSPMLHGRAMRCFLLSGRRSFAT